MILLSLISILIVAAKVLVAIALFSFAAIWLNAYGDPGYIKACKHCKNVH